MYVVVLESSKDPLTFKSPKDYTNAELKSENYESYKRARDSDGEIKPYITALLTRNQYDNLNGTFTIGKPDQPTFAFYAAPKYKNGELFSETKYYYFLRAHVNEVIISSF